MAHRGIWVRLAIALALALSFVPAANASVIFQVNGTVGDNTNGNPYWVPDQNIFDFRYDDIATATWSHTGIGSGPVPLFSQAYRLTFTSPVLPNYYSIAESTWQEFYEFYNGQWHPTGGIDSVTGTGPGGGDCACFTLQTSDNKVVLSWTENLQHIKDPDIEQYFWPGEVFFSGTYQVADIGKPFSLIIEAVPEPSTWAMFIIGFGLMGWMLRDRKERLQRSF